MSDPTLIELETRLAAVSVRSARSAGIETQATIAAPLLAALAWTAIAALLLAALAWVAMHPPPFTHAHCAHDIEHAIWCAQNPK